MHFNNARPLRVRVHRGRCIAHLPSFFNSSLCIVSHANTSETRCRTSAAPQSPRSCRRRPSSLPIDARCRQGSVSPPLSNLSYCQPRFALSSSLGMFQARVPSTGKSSNSSSSSSCVAGFLSCESGCSPFLGSAALVVAVFPCAGPAILTACAVVWVYKCVG
ncbi:hypothetical protein P153DRAFT_199134 [Dothidotthia symphoricarpi CBS 119687]|uniref:Uncharacterized protein n=1 Tax=Dothidotthia symphoricarpi CBS 119687 TaxID=1392245 RepID=A0A6A6AI26_9PLEO|nr:uncharacterized protein P153DRAFT_199134 [Dothidotthia symphoricarpi CBS 119687]KAF2131599.1 hypothetical protein P153DRAFT_199134 [Dothidotthia symphoricarpi CBS 119687]